MKSFDEIVFEKRNKEYGSYVLRKRYPKIVGIAMIVAMVLFSGVIAYPLINNYINKGRLLIKPSIEVGVEMKTPDVTPPPPPPPPSVDVKAPKFTAPVVVEEDVETNISTQDEMAIKPNNNIPITNDDVIVKDETPQTIIETPKQPEIFTVVEEQPMFNGDLYEYLSNQIKYPEEAKELGIQGKVYVTFVVEKDGSITDIKVLRGIGGGCDEEAVRVVKTMPNWTPGKQRGNAVRVQFNLPIKFTLQ